MDPAEEWARDRGALPPEPTRRDHLIGCGLMVAGALVLGLALWQLMLLLRCA
jgi:hypothetical protein